MCDGVPLQQHLHLLSPSNLMSGTVLLLAGELLLDKLPETLPILFHVCPVHPL